MMKHVFAVAAVLGIALGASSVCSAQGRSGGGSSGFGSSGMGSSGMGSSGFGSSGFGSSGIGGGMGSSGFGGGMGSSGFGGGGMGSSGFGGSGMGSSGFGNSGFGGSGMGGSGMGGNQYGGGGASFVGRDATDMSSTFMQNNRASTQFFNNMNQQMRRQNKNNKQTATTQNPPQPMRMQVRAADDAPQKSPQAIETAVRTRVLKILAKRQMTQPVLAMQGDTMIVSGVAASDRERMLIGQLVSLEPGVREVRNEMTLAGEATSL